MFDLNAHLTIERLGARGEGVARHNGAAVFTPYALAGETIRAEVDGERGRLIEILTPSPDRIAAFCPLFGVCGGCAVQTLAAPAYAAWKRELLGAALAHAGVAMTLAPLASAGGLGRRRVELHARTDAQGRAVVGFMQARAHTLAPLAVCPLLAPALARAPEVARALAAKLAAGKPFDIAIAATDGGLDVDLRGLGALDEAMRQRAIAAAAALDLARLSNHGAPLIVRRAPCVRMGAARVTPPPGAFLQATEAGEAAIAAAVADFCGPARRIADLFAGVGTFSLRLAERAAVHAVEYDDAAGLALARAARETPGLRAVTVECRDLFARPLTPAELAGFDAVVFDPPRAGAPAQAKALAASVVPTVVAVSCNPQTFARDARILVDGGYTAEGALPIDQFLCSPHLETVGVFRKPRARKPKRGLLSR